MEKPKTKSDVIRTWLKENPRGSFADFQEAHPTLEVSRSLWSHVSKSRRKLKKLRPKLKGRRVIAQRKVASG
jgi:hypothetical protein